MKLSIIVPVYNVEAYLPQCLESCLHQNIESSEYEIIIVNDGSPDNSSIIISEYCKEYSNIVVIDKKNGGLSSARNAGLKIAKGDYVWFVDSDDWIEDNCLSDIISLVEKHVDVVAFNTFIHKSEKISKVMRNLSSQVEYEGGSVFNKSFIYPYSGAQFFLFNRNFLISKGLNFKEGIYYEDLLFTSEVLSVAKTCVAHYTPCYHYRLRENSITTSSLSDKKIIDMFSVMDSQHEWAQTIQECDHYVMAGAICKTANSLFRRFILKVPKNERSKWLQELKKREYWKQYVSIAGGLKNHIYYYIVFKTFYF